jgi:hypothetical protein
LKTKEIKDKKNVAGSSLGPILVTPNVVSPPHDKYNFSNHQEENVAKARRTIINKSDKVRRFQSLTPSSSSLGQRMFAQVADS